MWKRREDEPTPPVREAATPVMPMEGVTRRPEPERETAAPSRSIATIGKSVLVKGQLSGSEDLYIDGEVEGTVELRDHNLTVGPNGRVNASLHARDIVVLGKVKGNVQASDRLEIRKSGSLVGDIVTARVVIEDGAYFKGSIDIQKAPAAVPAAKAEPRRAEVSAIGTATAASPPASAAPASPAAAPASPGHFSLAPEVKKL